MNMATEIKKLKPKRNYWKKEEEVLLKQWADKAKCYHWLHNKSREIYQRKNAWFTIPVIIISTIVGTANFAQDRFSEENRQYVVIAIGSLSIIAGIITTIYQFLKISEINEGHRVSLLSWGKYYLNIEAELARHPLDRMPPSQLIKISKNEFNRLLEISPFIPKKVLSEFNKKFKKSSNLIKPEIGNNINPLTLFSMDNINREKMINDLNRGLIIKNKEMIQKKVDKETRSKKFRDSFFELNNREPTSEEIKKNLKYIDENNDNYTSDDSSNHYDEDELVSQSPLELNETSINTSNKVDNNNNFILTIDSDNTIKEDSYNKSKKPGRSTKIVTI